MEMRLPIPLADALAMIHNADLFDGDEERTKRAVRMAQILRRILKDVARQVTERHQQKRLLPDNTANVPSTRNM